MKVLIIKMTSMGDIVHTFPALTDAGNSIKDIRFDWVVENAFKELPTWHPLVDHVIPVAFRQWRKYPFKTLRTFEIFKVLKQIRENNYDMIIDAQGLLKSMIISCFAKGTRCGFDKTSSREPWVSFIYHKKVNVLKNQHAVMRIRTLFAKSLNYTLPTSIPDYGLTIPEILDIQPKENSYFVFLPNTTWDTKHWPEAYWGKLVAMITSQNYRIKIPWGSSLEEERAKRLAKNNPLVTVLPRMSITGVAHTIAHAKAIVTVDTGLAHVAAAYNIPSVSLYGPTDPGLSGTVGLNQTLLAAKFECAPCFKRKCYYLGDKKIDPPCFSTLSPEIVWDTLKKTCGIDS